MERILNNSVQIRVYTLPVSMLTLQLRLEHWTLGAVMVFLDLCDWMPPPQLYSEQAGPVPNASLGKFPATLLKDFLSWNWALP